MAGKIKIRTKIITVAVALFFYNIGFCITTGENLFIKAQQYLTKSYQPGEPPNYNYTDQLKNGYYHYGYYWGSSSWDGSTEWTGGFDCTGLVSYCANLRRHYGTSEFSVFLGSSKNWENGSKGDIIYWTEHTAIFKSRQWDVSRSTYTISVIHATRYLRYDGVQISSVIEEDYRQTYYEGKNAHPYPFKTDTTKPQITVTEGGRDLVNGKVYAEPVTIAYSVSDNIAENHGAYIKGNYAKNHTFDQEGAYTLELYAEDWAKNSESSLHHFIIATSSATTDSEFDGGEFYMAYLNGDGYIRTGKYWEKTWGALSSTTVCRYDIPLEEVESSMWLWDSVTAEMDICVKLDESGIVIANKAIIPDKKQFQLYNRNCVYTYNECRRVLIPDWIKPEFREVWVNGEKWTEFVDEDVYYNYLLDGLGNPPAGADYFKVYYWGEKRAAPNIEVFMALPWEYEPAINTLELKYKSPVGGQDGAFSFGYGEYSVRIFPYSIRLIGNDIQYTEIRVPNTFYEGFNTFKLRANPADTWGWWNVYLDWGDTQNILCGTSRTGGEWFNVARFGFPNTSAPYSITGAKYKLAIETTTAGSYISKVIDTGEGSEWETISWDAEVPAGCGVKFQTRTTPYPNSPYQGEWSNDYAQSGSDITSPAGRYVQYRVLLESDDPQISPLVKSVNIAYHRDYVPPPVIQGIVGESGDNFIYFVWNASPDRDTGLYNVYRATSPGCRVKLDTRSSLFYKDMYVTNGRTYSYWITAVDINGNESDLQSEPLVIMAGEGIPPAVITDLMVESKENIALSWTAVGSFGTEGTASGYILKYSTSSINSEEDFIGAFSYPQNWEPLSSGSKELKVLTGLEENKRWYFAVKTVNSQGITSGISNSVSSVAGNTRFVSLSGSDLNDGLTEETAFASIQKAVDSAVPGTRVVIAEGTYYNQTVDISTGGTVEKPILIQGRGEVILDGTNQKRCAIYCREVSNIKISRLQIKNYTDVGIAITDQNGWPLNYEDYIYHGKEYFNFNIEVSSCSFEGICKSYVDHTGTLYEWGKGIYITNSERIKIDRNEFSTTFCAIGLEYLNGKIEIDNNFCKGGQFITSNRGLYGGDVADELIIENNIITKVAEGITLTGDGQILKVRDNYIFASKIGISLRGACYDQTFLIENNNIISEDVGIYNRNTTNAVIRRNIIRTRENSGIVDEYSNYAKILNNTIIIGSATAAGIYSKSYLREIFNNIVFNYTKTNTTGIELQDITSGNFASYNCVYNFKVPVSTFPGSDNNANNPEFVDGGLGDYRLMVNSPCIDAGDPSPEYNDPDGTRCDIGAYYYGYEYPAPNPGYNTRAGGNVIVDLQPAAKVNFPYVYAQGNTQAVQAVPQGMTDYIIVPENTAYEITTDAEYEGRPVVGLNFSSGLADGVKQNLKILSYQEGVWTDVTLWRDLENNMIYGSAEVPGTYCKAYTDSLPPRTTISAGEPSYVDTQTIYVTDATTLTLTAVDDLINVGDESGLGVAEIRYKIDDNLWQVYTDTLSVAGEGNHTVYYYSVDSIGNTETSKASNIVVDNSPPEIGSFVAEPLYFSPNSDGIKDTVSITAALSEYADWTVTIKNSNGTVVETLTGSGEGTSGISALWSPSGIAEGDYSIGISATDRLGNYAGEFQENFNTLSDNLWTQGHSSGLSSYSVSANGWLNLTAAASISGQYGAVYAVSKESKSLTDEIEFNVRMRVPTEQNGSNGNFFWNEFYLLPTDLSGTGIQPHDYNDWFRFVARVDPDNTNPEDPGHFGVHWMVQRRVSGGGVGTIYTSYDDRNNPSRDFPYNMKEAEWHILINNAGNIYVDLTDINGMPIRVEDGAYQKHFNTAYVYASQRTNYTNAYTCGYDYVKISDGLNGKVTADLTQPSSVIVLPDEGGIYNQLSAFTGSAQDSVKLDKVCVKLSTIDESLYWDAGLSSWTASGVWNDTQLNGSTWAFSVPALTDGAYLVRSRAEDMAGNFELEGSTGSANAHTFSFDSEGPDCGFVIPQENEFVNTLSQVLGTSYDGIAGVGSIELAVQKLIDNLWWNGTGWASAESYNVCEGTSNWSYNISNPESFFQESEYMLKVRGEDNAGNISDSVSRNFTYDTVAPTSTILVPADDSYLNSLMEISGTSYDLNGSSEVRVSIYDQTDSLYWNGAVWISTQIWNLTDGTTNWIYAISNWSDGHYYLIQSKVKDLALNEEIPSAGNVFKYDIAPPSAVTSLNAETGETESKINLSWASPGDDGTSGVLTGIFRIDYSSFTKAWNESNYVFEISTDNCQPGSLFTKEVTGLTGGATCYFALWTKDRAQNWSDVSNIAQSIAQYDVTAPSAITGLAAVTGDKPYSISLNWTASGDDGYSGTASGYIVRYATFTIDGSNWGRALDYNNDWQPQSSGTVEDHLLPGLMPGTTYYIALKTFDEKNNISEISNLAFAISAETYLLISEVCIGTDGAGNEFVELYNPTEEDVVIDTGTFKLKLVNSSNGITTKQITWTNHIVPSKGYFLLGAGNISPAPDAVFASQLTGTSGVIITDGGDYMLDKVGWGNPAPDNAVEGSGVNAALSTGDSIERKTDASSTAESMSLGADRYAGNAYDINDNSADFVIHTGFYNPQNSSSDREPDLIPPSAVTDLAAFAGPGEGEVNLVWTAPGDEGTTGNNEWGNYVVKYSTAGEIPGAVSWEQALELSQNWQVNSPGAGENRIITGLEPGVTYWFAIKSADEAENYSDMDTSASRAFAAAGKDITAPSTVTDLYAFTGDNQGEIKLSWTAMGDDGTIGAASSYVLRYSTVGAIESENDFNVAADYANTWTPLPSGSLEQKTLTGLSPGVTHWFAIKARDNALNMSEISNSAVAEAKSTYLSVVINEIAWMGTAASAYDEWIELYNNTGDTVTLTDWTLASADGTPSITLSGSIAPYSYYLLERTDDTTVSDITADLIYSGALDNTAEDLTLKDSGGITVDRVNCSSGWFAGDNTSKISMERKNTLSDGSTASNWGNNDGVTTNGLDANSNALTATARAQNSLYGSATPEGLIISPADREIVNCESLNITGYADAKHGPAFKDWSLEWGEGAKPAKWQMIKYSTEPVTEKGILAEWEMPEMSGEVLTLRLTVSDVTGDTCRHDIRVYRKDIELKGVIEGLKHPTDVEVDRRLNVELADSGEVKLAKYSPREEALWKVEGNGIKKPGGVASDVDENVYLTDTLNNRILKFSATGHLLLEFGKDAGLKEPAGIAVSLDGAVYVADSKNERLAVFTCGGIYVKKIKIEGSRFGGINVNDEGMICAADTLNNRVVVIDPETGEVIRELKEGLKHPVDAVFDPSGNIYVSDGKNFSVKKFDVYGKKMLDIDVGSFVKKAGKEEPAGIALDREGNYLYVCLPNAGKVVKLAVREAL
ncbi:MAG: hypothetical protein FP827_03520, partial [Candidatus Omnitrophica bacterium]|nr:hypothetical protein [Candidatus Omnitrophota bacterium]